MGIADAIHEVIFSPLLLIYQLAQQILSWLLAPNPPPPNARLRRPRIAIVGAGLTGVSSASHCVGHGFDVTIFEAGPRSALGGIWTRVNNTSGLQINSIMYRFQPSVRFSDPYPKRPQIVEQIRSLWERYGLNEKTKFDCQVSKVYKDGQGRWIINDPSNGRYDGIIAAVGTCGDPKVPHIPGQNKFQGQIYHSTDLDGKSAKGKKVIVIGGGASAVEALEFVEHEQAEITNVLARSEKWILPRNAIVDSLLAMNIFGQETFLSWIPENLLRIFFYRDLADISPPRGSNKGLFTDTPMVNSKIMDLIRSGKAKWLRGDIQGFDEKGVIFNHRSQGVPKGGPGHTKHIEADICILATGFNRPSLSFLPDEHFTPPYAPPAWYLQVFPPSDASILANNCTFVNAIGTVGNFHIGCYTRFLLMALCDPLAAPTEDRMKFFVKFTTWFKRRSLVKPFEFFTLSELTVWLLVGVLANPFRWKWALFVLFGIGSDLPLSIVGREERFREEVRSSSRQVNGI